MGINSCSGEDRCFCLGNSDDQWSKNESTATTLRSRHRLAIAPKETSLVRADRILGGESSKRAQGGSQIAERHVELTYNERR